MGNKINHSFLALGTCTMCLHQTFAHLFLTSEKHIHIIRMYTGVSKNSGIPKMDGENNENPIKMDDLAVPPFTATPIYVRCIITR